MVTERTKIWIDRSNRGAPNEIGSFGDLKRGWLVEVKYEDERSRENATWIKVRPDARE